MVGGISLENRLSFQVKLCQDWRVNEHILQFPNGYNLGWVPVPGLVLSHELGLRFGDCKIVPDEPTVQVAEAEDLLWLFEVLGWFPVLDSLQLY